MANFGGYELANCGHTDTNPSDCPLIRFFEAISRVDSSGSGRLEGDPNERETWPPSRSKSPTTLQTDSTVLPKSDGRAERRSPETCWPEL